VMTGKDGTYSVPFRIDDSMSGGVEYFVEASRAGMSTRLKDGSHASPHRFSVAPAP